MLLNKIKNYFFPKWQTIDSLDMILESSNMLGMSYTEPVFVLWQKSETGKERIVYQNINKIRKLNFDYGKLLFKKYKETHGN